MQFTPQNVNDIDRYYRDTYVKFKEYGERLFYIQSVSPSMVTGTDEDGTYFEVHLRSSNPYQMDYILPHKAVFQYKDNVYLLQRIPAKQYRRGLCSGNTQIIRVTDGEKIPMIAPILKAFVNKQNYSTFSEAFKSKHKAFALGPRMHFLKADAGIYIDMTLVARHFYGTEKIQMIQPIFTSEIKKHMTDNNDMYEVI